MNTSLHRGMAILVVLSSLGSCMAAISPHQKLMAKRAAELDAYRNMTERVLGLQVSSESKVLDFVGESDKIQTHMDHFIKGLRIDDDMTRWYDDGSCEVVVEVTLEKVIKELESSCDQYYRGGKWTKESFERMTTHTEDRVLTEIGSAAVREESVIPEPQGVPVVMPLVNPRDQHIDLPDIYSQYPARNRLMAKRIATVDAYRKLVERIYGLKINADTRVIDFDNNMSSDAIRTRLSNEIKGMRTDDVRYQPDGIVEVQVSLTLEQVVTTLKKVCDEYYSETGKKIKTEKFEEIKKQTNHRTVTVLGMGSITGKGPGTESTSGMQAQPDTAGRRRTTTTEVIEEGPEVIKID